jgi:hypothetical protein
MDKISSQAQMEAIKRAKKFVKSLENWRVNYYITGRTVVMTKEIDVKEHPRASCGIE